MFNKACRHTKMCHHDQKVGHKISQNHQKSMPTLSAADTGVNITPVSNTTHSGWLSTAASTPSSSIAHALDTDAFAVGPPDALETDAFTVDPPPISVHRTHTLPVPRPRTPRMKFAKCGIRATKAFFLHPDKVEMYPTLSGTVYFDGKIDQCHEKRMLIMYFIGQRWLVYP